MRTETLNRYLAIQARFKQLFESERLRYDDVINKLCAEFFIRESTLFKILKKELNDKE